MTFLITEVQLSSVVLMGLVTSLLMFTLPRLGSEQHLYKQARRYLCLGTTLVTIHFMIQYYIHKTGLVTGELRTCINLIFGIPLSYFFNLSLLHLQRMGHVRWKEHLHIIFCFLVSAILYEAVYMRHGYNLANLHLANVIVAIIYAYTLVYADYLLFMEFFRMLRSMAKGHDERSQTLVTWTRHAMYFMIGVGLGFPIMTFVQNEILRSIYGIISIAVAHFYVFSFIAYHLNRRQAIAEQARYDEIEARRAEMAEEIRIKDAKLAELTALQPHFSPNEMSTLSDELNTQKQSQLSRDMSRLERERIYLRTGLTLKDLSIELDVSTTILASYFQRTTYGKFNQWLQVMRIEEAKRLLIEHPDWSNENVAQQCGYTSRAYFQKQFSEHTGLTPTLWQKAMLHRSQLK